MKWVLAEDPGRARGEALREDRVCNAGSLQRAGSRMSYANRFPSSQHTRYRSSWGPTSVSVFDRADVPRPSPEEEEFAEFYHERLHSAQSRQLIPLQEDLADWINKTISKYTAFIIDRAFPRDEYRFGKKKNFYSTNEFVTSSRSMNTERFVRNFDNR